MDVAEERGGPGKPGHSLPYVSTSPFEAAGSAVSSQPSVSNCQLDHTACSTVEQARRTVTASPSCSMV